MRLVEPAVYFIAKSHVDREEARRWLDALGAEEYHIPDQCTEAELLTTLSGKRCYLSFQAGLNPNVTRVRQEMVAFIENILNARHGSVLEHATYTFALENVSRVFTAEMNRHRAGWAISEGSMRYIRFTDIPFWMPLSIRDDDDEAPDVKAANARTRAVFTRAFQQMEENYRDLEEIWALETLKSFKQKKKITSMMRRIIGMGVASGGVWTGNLRAVRHVLSVRVDAAAEEEIAYVFSIVLKRMIEEEPAIFADFVQTDDGFWTPTYWKV